MLIQPVLAGAAAAHKVLEGVEEAALLAEAAVDALDDDTGGVAVLPADAVAQVVAREAQRLQELPAHLTNFCA
jgi:hypothetical protein